MKNLNSKEINILIGKIYFFDGNLYSQIDKSLNSWKKVQTMLEEVNDKTIKAYLTQKKGEILNDILYYTSRSNYPNYPEMAEEPID